jgi:hypothetical protein
MPNLDVVSENVAGAKIFALFDFLKGYWQTPLHKDCQELLSMVTDRAVYTPTRVIMGVIDAVMYFQSTMQKCFEERLYKSLIIWIDDLLSYATNVDDLLENMDYIFRTCHEYRLKLNPDKCSLFMHSVKFCGKIFSADGIAQDPERVKSLSTMPPPTTAGELQQYLCALNWMRSSIPDFARLSKSLRQVLEKAAKGTSRKSQVLKRIPITLHEEAKADFRSLNACVANTVMLAHPSQEADFFLFTDASDDGWGSVLFQIHQYDEAKDIQEQNPEPLYFLSGRFTDAKHRWSIPEKEAFAIVESVERLDFMLIRAKPFHIMTDHRNLVYIFASNTHLKQATRHKISRWALALTSFNYIIKHIDGESNVWADLLSRWGQSPAPNMMVKALALHPFEEGNDFVFPDIHEIWKSQRESNVDLTKRADLENRIVDSESRIFHNGKPWIPECDDALWKRILIVAHCGIGGHRGVASTTRVLQQYCSTRGLRSKVLDFMKLCLLCLQTKGGKIIPRPLGRSIQAEEPWKVLHFDFYFVGEATNGWKYVLVMKDGLSHFVELVGCATTSSGVAVEALLDWFKRFGIVPTWVSDQPTHFRNAVIAALTRKLKSCHHFVTAYCPWANGSVERVNRELGTLFRAILAEFKMPFEHWPQVLPILQYVLNQTPVESLCGLAPIQVAMGREPTPPIKEIFNPSTQTFTTVAIDSERLQEHFQQLRNELAQMHKNVVVQSKKNHERNQRKYNVIANFDIGDFVLWSRVDSTTRFEKLQFIWRGPFQVVDTISDQVFRIEHLTSKKQSIVHASRLKFYHDRSLNVTAELEEHVETQGFLYDIKSIDDFRWNPTVKRWEFNVLWSGFEESEATWEPFLTLLKDIPEQLQIFLSNTDKKQERKKLMRKHKKAIAKSPKCKSLLEER